LINIAIGKGRFRQEENIDVNDIRHKPPIERLLEKFKQLDET